MPIDVRPTTGNIGADIRGVELAELADGEWPIISEALTSYGLLIFRDQFLDREDHISLALRLGQIDEFDTRVPNASQNPFVAREHGTRVITEISNLDSSGVLLPEAAARAKHLGRPEQWRSDGSFKEMPVEASILAAVEITPGAGGSTEFADMQAAFAALPEVEQRHLEALTAWHSAVYVKAAAAEIPLPAAADPTAMTGAAHPVVTGLPSSGQKALYIGENACAILGMTVSDSQLLLERLRSSACRSAHVHAHQWRAGDVVIWDARRFLHRTMEWDPSRRRALRHISVAG